MGDSCTLTQQESWRGRDLRQIHFQTLSKILPTGAMKSDPSILDAAGQPERVA
jgi:hypothetical protein